MAVSTLTSSSVISSDTTYYIRTDGNNSNLGTSNTAGGAWASIGGAITNLKNKTFGPGVVVTLQLADGTYVSSAFSKPDFPKIIINGNSSTPANVVVTGFIDCSFGAVVEIRNGYYEQCSATYGGLIIIGTGVRLTATSGSQIVVYHGGTVQITASYSCSGSCDNHIFCASGGLVQIADSLTLTLVSTPAYSGAFCNTPSGGIVRFYNFGTRLAFSGTATGVRYIVSNGGVIDTSGGGSTVLPGNSVGTNSAGYYL